ncbi:MAG TPA: type II toxin-antitoxin system VapC family toxin [Rhizomicrobium sp.]|jgi:PIN domain nuclease of toxin-antitoxin system
MRLLLDSNIVVPFTRREMHLVSPKIELLLGSQANEIFVSTASLWEIAIKTRLGKLDPKIPLADIPGYFVKFGFLILPVDEFHAVEHVTDPPATRDPFDRLLLAQCQVENLLLVTVDRALIPHRLAWR